MDSTRHRDPPLLQSLLRSYTRGSVVAIFQMRKLRLSTVRPLSPKVARPGTAEPGRELRPHGHRRMLPPAPPEAGKVCGDAGPIVMSCQPPWGLRGLSLGLWQMPHTWWSPVVVIPPSDRILGTFTVKDCHCFYLPSNHYPFFRSGL